MASGIRVDVTVEGAEEIKSALKRAGSAAEKILKQATLKGAEVIRDEAERRAPRDEGELAANIVVEVDKGSRTQTKVKIGPDKKRFWGLFQEFGTDPHAIPYKGKRVTTRSTKKMLLIADDVIRARAEHPGIKARPFMRPAFDKKQDEAEEIVAEEIKKALRL